MWSNLRAAQALTTSRYKADRHHRPVIRVADRIPDWFTSPVTRLNAVRQEPARKPGRRQTHQAA